MVKDIVGYKTPRNCYAGELVGRNMQSDRDGEKTILIEKSNLNARQNNII